MDCIFKSVYWNKNDNLAFIILFAECMCYICTRLIDWLIFWCFNATFRNISAISWWPVLVVERKPEYPERTTDPGQATGKLYHLRLRVECTFYFTKLGSNPRRIGDRFVWAVRSNDLTHWATLYAHGYASFCGSHIPIIYSFMTYHWILNII
jgi:hypothetical protein